MLRLIAQADEWLPFETTQNSKPVSKYVTIVLRGNNMIFNRKLFLYDEEEDYMFITSDLFIQAYTTMALVQDEQVIELLLREHGYGG